MDYSPRPGHSGATRLNAYTLKHTHWKISSNVPKYCTDCLKGKNPRVKFLKVSHSSADQLSRPLERLYLDTMEMYVKCFL